MAVIVYAAVFVLLMNKAHYPCEKERKKEKKGRRMNYNQVADSFRPLTVSRECINT